MTMMLSEQLKLGQHEKGLRNFHERFDLNVTAPELEQHPDVQWELLENHYSQYSELPGRMEKHKDHYSEEAQQHGEQVPQTNTFEGCVNHLLILAQSAEMVAQSEDSAVGMHTNNQNKGSHNSLVDQMSQKYASNVTADDQECSRELLDRLSVDSHVSSPRCGFCYEVTRPRLTQIRKQARCKCLILDQKRVEDNQCKHLQRKTIRLSQIKHQARCKSKNELLPREMITGPRNEQPQGRILRLSQMKHQARSIGNSTAEEGTEDMDGSLHCNKFKDNKEKVIARQFVKEDIFQGDSNLSVVEGVPAHKFFRGSSQSSVVRRDDENLREQQRTARQLRAFKTKKLRQQLRTECISNPADMRVHGTKMSPIGLTSITNSRRFSRSATLLKDKDLIACEQELPKPSRCNEKLRANFGAEKLQGHLGSSESSGLRCKSHQNIPNGLPVQNNVLNTSFTRLPNNIFQQCDTNMGWMFYMHHMQLKEYHRVVARQRRAERIEEKRALKDKHQNSKNPVQSKTASVTELYQAPLKKDKDFQHLANSLFHEGNSDAPKELMPVKRLRLTQLRREVRLGNQCSVMQGPAEN